MVVGAAVLCLAAPSVGRADGATERVSVSSREAQGNDFSVGPTISGNGRFVGFVSAATNLVRGDTNELPDIFVRDRRRGTTQQVTVGPGGQGQNDRSFGHAIARNGRFYAFASLATNLVPGDTNGVSDVFVRDLRAGVTRRASVGAGGAQANGEGSGFPAISADGRYVVFTSGATNLVRGDTNGFGDLFVRDRRTRTTTRINLGPGGVQGNGESVFSLPAISADGRFVAFDSEATNLVRGDTNGFLDVFVRDRQRGETKRVNVGDDGAQADDASTNPSISDDGRYVVFFSSASNLVADDTNDAVDVFVRDVRKGRTQRVSVGPDGRQANANSSVGPSAISADGRFVTFVSLASNLVPGDTNGVSDVFVRDLRLGRTSRVSLRAGGGQSSGPSGGPFNAISADGRFVAFFAVASDLVPGDTNDVGDVFVRDRRARR